MRAVGTVKKSIDTRSRTWLVRNVRQGCDGDERRWAQPGDGALGDLQAQLQEFAMDSGSAPQRIGRGHLRDQGADLGVDRRPAHGGASGERGPVVAEVSPLPSQHGGWSNNDEGPPPPCPHP